MGIGWGFLVFGPVLPSAFTLKRLLLGSLSGSVGLHATNFVAPHSAHQSKLTRYGGSLSLCVRCPRSQRFRLLSLSFPLFSDVRLVAYTERADTDFKLSCNSIHLHLHFCRVLRERAQLASKGVPFPHSSFLLSLCPQNFHSRVSFLASRRTVRGRHRLPHHSHVCAPLFFSFFFGVLVFHFTR